MDGEILLAKSETDIAVASITAAGIVPGVITVGNQQITVEGAPVETSSENHFGEVVNVEGQMATNAQYHVNQLNEELLRGGELSTSLKSAVQVIIGWHQYLWIYLRPLLAYDWVKLTHQYKLNTFNKLL